MTKPIAELSLMLFAAAVAAVLSPRIARWLTSGSKIVATRRVVCAALVAAALSLAAMALTGLWLAWMAEHVDVDAAIANPNGRFHSGFVPRVILAEAAIGCLAVMVIAALLIVDTFLNRSRSRGA